MWCQSSVSLLFDAESETLRLEVSERASKRYQAQPVIHAAETALGYVVKRQKPWSVSQISESPQDPHTELIRKEGIHSFLAVPLAEKRVLLGFCVSRCKGCTDFQIPKRDFFRD